MVPYAHFLEHIHTFCHFISDVHQGTRAMADLSHLQRDVLAHWGTKIHLQRGCGQQLAASPSVTAGVHDRVDPPWQQQRQPKKKKRRSSLQDNDNNKQKWPPDSLPPCFAAPSAGPARASGNHQHGPAPPACAPHIPPRRLHHHSTPKLERISREP